MVTLAVNRSKKTVLLVHIYFVSRQGLTLEEAIQMVYVDDLDVSQIYIEPPDPNVLTDEDSGDEDGGGLLDNLSGSQLTCKAEIILQCGARNMQNDDGPFTEEQNLEDSEPHQIRRPGLEKISWIQGDIEELDKCFPKPDYKKYEGMSNLEIFEMFIDSEIVELLVEQSRNYALFCNRPDPTISPDEMKCVIGILIVTGYNQLPGRDFYWDSQKDMKNSMVSESMRRDRFRQIIKYLHCADNTHPSLTDKIWKLRPLMDKLKSKFIKNWVPEQHLDYDESMVKYYGRHSCKQFIRGKPVRFGYKMWCLNSASGYLVNFDMYQGKNPRGNIKYENDFGKCAAPLITMIDELPEDTKKLNLKFYFDNLFTGLNLLFHLKQRGYDGTGTIRENRIPKTCILPQKSVMSKTKKRGDIMSAVDKEDGIILVKWVDNNIVTAASTCHGVNPISQVKRYSQAGKKIIQIPQPRIICEYNRCMGGTDLMDQHISRYRVSVRRKKWWWSIFTWLLDVATVNAWTIRKNYKGEAAISQLEFRREIAQIYLNRFGIRPKAAGRPSTSKSSISLNRVSDNLRYDRLDHLLIPVQGKKRRRCAGEGCSSSVRTMCMKCDVGLCIECNFIFHTK